MARSQAIAKVLFGIFTFITFMTSTVQAAAVTFSYHGRVFDEVKELPITGRANFKLKITGNNNSCILYAENHNNVKLSQYGVFSLEVGVSQKIISTDIYRDSTDPGLTMAQAFGFVSSSSVGPGCMSDLTPQDTRKLVVEISAANYNVLLDPQPILASPIAALAFSLNGYTENNFIQINSIVTQSAIEELILKGGQVGPAGPVGPRGLAGLPGDPGPKGDAGEPGPAGAKGDKGDPGAPGEQGLPGVAGAKGEQGIPGVAGAKGDKGDRGVKGDKGDKGDRGAKGDKGLPGVAGAIGPQGPKGDKGDRGAKGDTGERGPRGLTGPAGLVKSFMCPSGQFLRGINSSGNPVCQSICDKNLIGEIAYNNCRTDITWVGRNMTSKTIPGQCEDPGCSYRGPATTTWTGETHAETCSRVKMKVVASHPFGTCASGEARPTQGKNNEKINYQFGTWGGSGVGGVDSNNGSCYRAGQKRDNDKTDLTVAYLCGAN